MGILENQNQGKFAECSSYQAQLQHNLMFLARIADAQPQGVTMASQMPPLCSVQQEHHMNQEHCMQPPQVEMSQQPIYFSPQLPFQLDGQQQLPPYLQQLHLTHGQMRMRQGATDGDTEA